MSNMLPEGFESAQDSRHLCNLDWVPIMTVTPPPRNEIVIVKGTTGMRHPKDTFIALAFFDEEWHPRADQHWYDMNNDNFGECGWIVTHWCEL